MSSKYTVLITSLIGAILAAIAPGQTVPASTAAAKPSGASDEIIHMEPFAVVPNEEGYMQSTSTVATRTNRQTIEIPQTIAVFTDDFLKDIGAFDAETAITYVGNMYVRDDFGNPGNTIIRGFERAGEVYVDGFRDAEYPREAAAYDRMEVVKGPPSAVQGRSGSSGLINWVTKKPTLGRHFAKTDFTYVTGGYQELGRAVIDVNRTLINKRGNALGARAVMIYQHGDSYIDLLPNNVSAIYPSVRWKWRDDTEFNLVGGLFESETPSRNIGTGVFFYARKFRDKFSDPNLGGSPDDPISALNLKYGANPTGPDTVKRNRVGSATASVSHRFNDICSVRQGYQFLSTSLDSTFFEVSSRLNDITKSYLGVPGVWTPLSGGGTDRIENRQAIQGDVSATYSFSPSVKATLLAGYEAWDSQEKSDGKNFTIARDFQRINFAEPFHTDPGYFANMVTSSRLTNRIQRRVQSVGYYAQQEIELFRRVLAQGAWRHDAQYTTQRNRITRVLTTDISDSTNSYRFGGTVFLNSARTLVAYGVYSDQREPTRTRLVYNGLAPGDPRDDERLTWDPIMKLTEFGIKGQLLDQRLSVTLCRFNMTMEGNLNTYGQVMESMGQILQPTVASLADSTNQGWEVSVTGAIYRNVSLVANAASNRSTEKRVVGSQILDGRMHRVPENDMNIFVKWDLRGKDRNGFSVRAGMNRYSVFEGTYSGFRDLIEEPMTRYNAGVNYSRRNVSIDVFVTNLTNEPIFLMRGAPLRTFKFRLAANW